MLITSPLLDGARGCKLEKGENCENIPLSRTARKRVLKAGESGPGRRESIRGTDARPRLFLRRRDMKVNWKLTVLLSLAFLAGGLLTPAVLNRVDPSPVECHPAVILLEPHSPEPLVLEAVVCATYLSVEFPE